MARLHSRIYLHFLGVLLVVAVTTAVVFALGARDAFRREMAPRITRHLASLVGERLADPAALGARLRQIHEDLQPAYELLQVQVNPIAIKAALNLLGHDVGGLRLPLVDADEGEIARVRDCLERLGVLSAATA